MVDGIAKNARLQRKCGNACIIQNATTHIGVSYQERHSLSTLEMAELETAYDRWDQRILEVSHKVQSTLPDVDLFSVSGCFAATLAVRNAIGRELQLPLAECIHYFEPNTGVPK